MIINVDLLTKSFLMAVLVPSTTTTTTTNIISGMMVLPSVHAAGGSTLSPGCDGAFAVTTTAKTYYNYPRRSFLSYISSSLFLSDQQDDKTTFGFGPYRDGTVKVARQNNDDQQQDFSLYYRLYNPDSNSRIPIVVCHGGPSLPSQYLYPLVPLLDEERRPILFFDQLGCGKSDEPKDLSLYSIENTVQDLQTVVRAVLFPQYTRFHLYGHSFGGIVAYEYYYKQYCAASAITIEKGGDDNSKQQKTQPTLASLVLSNTPTDLGKANSNYDKLYAKNPLTFWKNHACKVGIPAILKDAMQHTGSPKIWSGMDAIPNYQVKPLPPLGPKSNERTPVLILSGSQDFAYPVSNEEAWRNVFLKQTTQQQPPSTDAKIARSSLSFSVKNFDNCAHYPFYENGATYGTVINEFLKEIV